MVLGRADLRCALLDMKKLISTACAAASDAANQEGSLPDGSLPELIRPGNAAILAGIDQAALTKAIARFRSATRIGMRRTAARSTGIEARHHALARRLTTREADYLRFTANPDVSFDNNAAEREIRMIKVRQKISGCLRTFTGAEQFCAIRSYLATAQKHEITFFDALTRLAGGQAWLPQTS
jgi:transposase